jgi:ABC-type multidrug transport system fused ATPase/permease subunit
MQPQPHPSRLHRLEARFLRPHRRALALAVAGMLAQSLLVLPVPVVQGMVLDRLGGSGGPAWAWLGLLVMVGCVLGRLLLATRVAAVTTRVSLEVIRDLTDELHRKLQRLSLASLERVPAGDWMARLTSDVGTLLIFLGSGSLQLLSDLVLAAGIVAVLFWISPLLAGLALTVVPLCAANGRLFAPAVRRRAGRLRGELAELYALVGERLSAVRVVRAFAQEPAELERFVDRLDRHRRAGLAALAPAAWSSALALLAAGLAGVAVIACGVALVRQGRLTLGELLAFNALAAMLFGPAVRLTQLQGLLAATGVAIDRMTELLDADEELSDAPGAPPLLSVKGEITFADVSFAYPGGPRVLDRVHLRLPPGKTLAVVGPSGAGKSTLLALAARLHDAGSGQVSLDGADVRGLRQADLRRAVALVPQRPVLFEDTLRANLLYAAPEAEPAAVWRVLEAVDLDRFIAGLPDGLDTPLGEQGVGLSGGQRQRLALARALLADPAVLLLDDCTSALDRATAVRVRAAVRALRPGRSALVVTHDPAAACEADLVCVLEAGRVAELGPPAELLGRGGAFAALCREARAGLLVA